MWSRYCSPFRGTCVHPGFSESSFWLLHLYLQSFLLLILKKKAKVKKNEISFSSIFTGQMSYVRKTNMYSKMIWAIASVIVTQLVISHSYNTTEKKSIIRIIYHITHTPMPKFWISRRSNRKPYIVQQAIRQYNSHNQNNKNGQQNNIHEN